MNKLKWLYLQLFAGEGSGGDGGEGAATGETASDPGEQRLRELGVPEPLITRRAKRAAARLPAGAVSSTPVQEQKPAQEQAAAATTPAEETETEKTDTQEARTEEKPRLSWEEIKKDPEYNREIQAIVQSRLKNAKGAEDALGKLTPALELLARKHGLDAAKLDYDALAKAISGSSEYYEDKAVEMGVSVETAMEMDQQERDTARAQREQARTLEEQKFQQHIVSLEQQGEAMKKLFPGFDLRAELQNPAFARMTSPNVGVSVEDAYYAVHRKEIQAAVMQVTAQKTAQMVSNSVQAGSQRPRENGTTGQAPSVSTFDYSKASREQRDALKRLIRSEAANGRKVYPGSVR